MIETKFKNSEVGLIPEDWEVKPIGSVADILNGSTPPTANPENYGTTHLFVSPADLGDSKYIENTIKKLSTIGFSVSRKIPKGSILYTCTGSTIGKCGIAFCDLTSNQQINAVLPNGSYNNEYLYYAIQTRESDIRSNASVQAVPLINKTTFSKTLVAFPPKTEQSRIAEALSDMDDLIAITKKLIEKKRNIKEGAMQDLLSGKRRLPGFNEKWVSKKIDDIGYTYNGLSGKSKEDFGTGNAKYITFLNVLNNPIIDTSIFEKVVIHPNERQNEARNGDLFFNTSSETPDEVGICACLLQDIKDLYLNSFCFGFRLSDEEIDSLFMAYLWRSRKGRDIMTMLAQGSTRFNLSKSLLRNTSIEMPQTKEEQQAIAQVLSDMDSEIQSLEVRLTKYQSLKQGMMQQLLTGKIRLI